MNAKLDRMGPSVQCADDAMILRLKGRKTPHFAPPRLIVSCLMNRMVLNMVKHAADAVYVKGTFQQFLVRSFCKGVDVMCLDNRFVRLMNNLCLVSNVWKPLLSSRRRCGFTVASHSSRLLISAPYKEPCVRMEV